MNIGRSDRNITAKVLGVLFAVVLWFNVTTNAMFTDRIELPIRYAGPPEGYMVTGGSPDHIAATIEGSGKSLVAYNTSRLFRNDQRYALVNLTDLSKGEHHITIEPGDVNLAVDSDIRIADIGYPENAEFTIFIDRVVTSTVPVTTDSLGQYSVERGLVAVGDPGVEPPQVALTGAQEVLARIRSIPPKPFNDRVITRADSVVTVDLVTPEYTTANPPVVNLRFKLDQMASRRLNAVPVRLRNFPRDGGWRAEPESLMVDVRGAASVVSALDPATLRFEITYYSYKEQAASGDSLVMPSVVLPDGIVNIGFTPLRVRLVSGS